MEVSPTEKVDITSCQVPIPTHFGESVDSSQVIFAENSNPAQGNNAQCHKYRCRPHILCTS